MAGKFVKIIHSFINSPAFAAMPADVFKLLVVLYRYRSPNSGTCYPSRDELARRLGCSRSTVSRLIHRADLWLREHCGLTLVTRERGHDGKLGRNVYAVPELDQVAELRHGERGNQGADVQHGSQGANPPRGNAATWQDRHVAESRHRQRRPTGEKEEPSGRKKNQTDRRPSAGPDEKQPAGEDKQPVPPLTAVWDKWKAATGREPAWTWDARNRAAVAAWFKQSGAGMWDEIARAGAEINVSKFLAAGEGANAPRLQKHGADPDFIFRRLADVLAGKYRDRDAERSCGPSRTLPADASKYVTRNDLTAKGNPQ